MSRHSTLRSAAVLLAVTAVLVVASTPAYADVPEGWSDPEPVSLIAMLAVILVIPTLLVGVISLLVLAPQAAKTRRERAGAGAPVEIGAGDPAPELEASSSD